MSDGDNKRPMTVSDRKRWLGIPSAAISDCLGRFGVMDGGVVALSRPPLIGPAFTVQTMPGDSAAIHLALEEAPEGTVLVVDAGGYRDRAVWGEVLTVAAQRVGVVGAVVDGATRDLGAIRARNFPLYARGTSPAGPHKSGGGRCNLVVQCGRVPVAPGDLVVGDEDGVVVIPRDDVERVYASVHERRRTEQHWLQRIESGESSASVLGLRRADLRRGP
jgi:4-hydroxy-4-methyl-2-oxoglutarate aldolase